MIILFFEKAGQTFLNSPIFVARDGSESSRTPSGMYSAARGSGARRHRREYRLHWHSLIVPVRVSLPASNASCNCLFDLTSAWCESACLNLSSVVAEGGGASAAELQRRRAGVSKERVGGSDRCGTHVSLLLCTSLTSHSSRELPPSAGCVFPILASST